MRMDTIKKIFNNKEMHLETMGTHSNSKAAADYCKKCGDYIEIKSENFIERKYGKGSRNDLVKIINENESYQKLI